ncbi:hypothetical protein WU69_03240 [Limosilactobacillus fermentum]|nr:hypothetical protein WU69_03240 [Limosilactobacillus fermentum]
MARFKNFSTREQSPGAVRKRSFHKLIHRMVDNLWKSGRVMKPNAVNASGARGWRMTERTIVSVDNVEKSCK